MQTILEAIGWIGSILVVWSLTQARVLRFRWMNLAGSVIATAYNAIFGIWPFFAMNLAIVIINIYWLNRLYRERHDEHVYSVLAVTRDNAFLQQVLAVHRDDVAAHEPGFAALPIDDARRVTFLITRGDEAVGVVALRDAGDGLGRVELDWVKPRFRNFTPGEFVYRTSGVLREAGFNRIEVAPHSGTDLAYLTTMGFAAHAGTWSLELA